MRSRYPLIAAAVTGALASGYAGAAVPTLAQANDPTAALVMAGSSAAASAVGTAIEKDLCGGAANTLIASSKGGSGNFLAFSCFTATAISTVPLLPANTLVTFYYRTEGGSVVGALPVVSNKQIKRLYLGDTVHPCTLAVNIATCTVNGTTSTSGTTDSWTGAVVADTVQLGVTDVEPGQLVGADFPSNYSAAAFGTATPAQLKALPTLKLFGQIFGLVVNKSGESFSTVNLSKESAANILLGNFSDWANVPDAITGTPISTGPAPITRVNREPGSGTRTATNIFFLNYQCGTQNSIPPVAGETLNFSTGDELTAANAVPGAIAYASIDQILNPSNGTKWTNLVLATIDGVTPSSLAAATGRYGFWYEATLVPETGLAGGSLSLSNFLQAELPKLVRVAADPGAPAVPDIILIPGVVGNAPTVPPTSNLGTGTTQIYVNPYTRAGNSCNVPGEQI